MYHDGLGIMGRHDPPPPFFAVTQRLFERARMVVRLTICDVIKAEIHVKISVDNVGTLPELH